MPGSADLFAKARAQLGDASAAIRAARTLVAKVDAATTVLRIIGTMTANAPTQELASRWLVEYRNLQPKAATLRAQLQSGAPSALVLEIGKFYDAVTSFAGKVLEGAGGLVQELPKAAKSIPLLIALALVVVAVIAIKVGPQLAGRLK